MKKVSLVLFSILLSGVLGCEALNTENKKSNSDDKIVKEDEEVEVKSLYMIDSYMKSVEENLEAKSETLISNIKELHKYTIYSKVELLDFVAFVDDPSEFNLSITMFSMDRPANEVFNEGKDSTFFAGSLGMIENVRYTHLLGNQTEDFWDFYEKNEEEINLAEKQAFANWVAD
ncbi:hypothetical protein [Peribacillus frigoritolerans]|uniref:hypothetical protein n=1 Tax=Peribacillus frigoritolerans TaxID=450367 RepID=UPI00363B6B7B